MPPKYKVCRNRLLRFPESERIVSHIHRSDPIVLQRTTMVLNKFPTLRQSSPVQVVPPTGNRTHRSSETSKNEWQPFLWLRSILSLTTHSSLKTRSTRSLIFTTRMNSQLRKLKQSALSSPPTV